MIASPGAPSRRQISDLVARYISMLTLSYRSRAWMNCRSHLARLITNVDRLDYEHLRDAARAVASDVELSKSYRRDTIGTWRRFLAWCSEEMIIDASTVDRFAHVRLRFPPPRGGVCSVASGNDGAGFTLSSTISPALPDAAPSIDKPRLGRPPGRVCRTAPDPRRDPEAFFEGVLAALPFFAPDLRDVVRLLAFTGARPSELLRLTTFAIDTSSKPWVACIEDHKTIDHTNQPKFILLNQAAMSILDRRLTPFCPHDWIFPAPKNVNASIARDLVQKRLKRTLTRNKLPTWTLYDLRRWAATVVRASEGLDAAQALLGHSRASTTEIYAPPDIRKAVDAARALNRRAES